MNGEGGEEVQRVGNSTFGGGGETEVSSGRIERLSNQGYGECCGWGREKKFLKRRV